MGQGGLRRVARRRSPRFPIITQPPPAELSLLNRLDTPHSRVRCQSPDGRP